METVLVPFPFGFDTGTEPVAWMQRSGIREFSGTDPGFRYAASRLQTAQNVQGYLSKLNGNSSSL